MKIFRKILIVLFSICISVYVSGQNHKLDSLRSVFKKAKNDTLRCNIYLEIGDFYEVENPDSSLYFYKKCFQLAESKKIKVQQATSLRYIGILHCTQGDYKEAIEYSEKSLKKCEELENSSDPKEVKEGKKRESRLFFEFW